MPIQFAPNTVTIGAAIAGGTNTRILFDDNGVLGENAGLTFTKTGGILAATVGAFGGATPGTNALAVTGSVLLGANLYVTTNVMRVNGATAIGISSSSSDPTASQQVGFSNPTGTTISADSSSNGNGNATFKALNFQSTTAPAGATAGLWKFGSVVTGAVVLDTTRSAYIDIGGALLKVMIAQ